MKISAIIQYSIMNTLRSSEYDIIIPNFYYGNYEMDVFHLKSPSLLINEYEIKTSRADFRKDFDKGGGKKHSELYTGLCRCNRFYYVVPEHLIDISEIPEYSGLIYAHIDGLYCRLGIVKSAPFIHRNKPKGEVFHYLATQLARRYNTLHTKYNYAVYKESIRTNNLVNNY